MIKYFEKFEGIRKYLYFLFGIFMFGCSSGIYLENWFGIGSYLQQKLPFLKFAQAQPTVYVPKFSLNSGFAAFPVNVYIKSNELEFDIYFYSTASGKIFAQYNVGEGTINTNPIVINAGSGTIKAFKFLNLRCASSYAFQLGFSNQDSSIYLSYFWIETGPCLV